MIGQGGQSVCLCMIVKDEVDVLKRCLDSCRDLITRWVICDTGSTDGTQELIAAELDGVPGELHQHAWVDFGFNRTQLMRAAHGKADYLLLLDADMTLTQHAPLPVLEADAYLVRQGGATLDCRNRRLVRGDLQWFYKGSTHEHIACADVEGEVLRLDAISIEHHADGKSREHKFERDLNLLRAELDRDPDKPRTHFYLAQTYRDMGYGTGESDKLALALEHYRRRAELPGWAEETYFAWYQIGVLCAELGDWHGAVGAFMRAWEERPARLEAVHALAAGLRERGLYVSAHRLTKIAASGKSLPIPEDILFVTPWIYRWGMLFEYSITSYWVGEFDESVTACARLLRRKDLPEPYRRQTIANMQYGVRESARVGSEQANPVRRVPKPGNPTTGLAA